MKKRLILFSVLIIVAFSHCSKEEEEQEIKQTKFRGTWSSGWPDLFHDGEPYESENFVVYRDKSSQVWRMEAAELAEKSLLDIMERFNLSNEDFDFVPLYRMEMALNKKR